MTVHPLRQALAAHLGQVLTPEVAAQIEGIATPKIPDFGHQNQLERWRHLIEPTVAASPTPMAWSDVLATPCQVYEGAKSVCLVVLNPPMAVVWVAAGQLCEVMEIFERICTDARQAGCAAVSYLGRRGWIRRAGFSELGAYGVKEI